MCDKWSSDTGGEKRFEGANWEQLRLASSSSCVVGGQPTDERPEVGKLRHRAETEVETRSK